MFLAIYNQNTLAQQCGNWVIWAAPEQLLSLGNQHLAVCQWTAYNICLKAWQWNLEKPLHPGEQDLHDNQGRSFSDKTFQNETKGLGVRCF
jgi:hypothetical protein